MLRIWARAAVEKRVPKAGWIHGTDTWRIHNPDTNWWAVTGDYVLPGGARKRFRVDVVPVDDDRARLIYLACDNVIMVDKLKEYQATLRGR